MIGDSQMMEKVKRDRSDIWTYTETQYDLEHLSFDTYLLQSVE